VPYSIVNKEDGRIQISPGITKAELKEIAALNNLSVVQFAEALSAKELDELREYVFTQRPNTKLRVWGHYSKGCDLSILKDFSFLKGLTVDCLLEAKNVEYITHLTNLEQLSVGIYNLTSFDFINEINADLKKMSIWRTFSKKPSIQFLSRFPRLESLYLEGHTNGITEIGKLHDLKKIVLRSITVPNLDFLQHLKHLWSVDIKLGGIKNFSALAKLPDLKYLELWQVNKLADISFISELKALQNLFIQSLPNVETLPNFEKNVKLRRIYLESLKGLKDSASLKSAPALEEFCYAVAQNQHPQNFIPLLQNQNVKKVLVGFGSKAKSNLFNEMVQNAGKEKYKHQKFIYN